MFQAIDMYSIKFNNPIAKKDTFRTSVIYLKMVKDRQSLGKNRF